MKKLTLLESIRGFAAIYVALGHWLVLTAGNPHLVVAFFKFGQEAVILFFLLSGFVIFYAHQKHPNEALSQYFIKRFRRIYFPLVCAMVVSVIFASHVIDYKELAGTLLMLQDSRRTKPGNIAYSFMGNLPLWSLSFEWMFYMLFPFVFPVIGKSRRRGHLIGIFSLINLVAYIIFPNHIFVVCAYFLIWWTGLEMGEYFFGDRAKSQHRILSIYYIITLLILAGVAYYNQHVLHSLLEAGTYPLLLIRHFAFAFVCMLLTFHATALTKKALTLLRPFAVLAPISYGIYILHYPIFIQTTFALPVYFSVPLKLIMVFGFAWLIEVVLQPRVNKILK